MFIEKAELIEKIVITGNLYIFRLNSPKIANISFPGQFVEIDPGEKFFLRRPFSIQNAENGILEILVKVVGDGTASLVELTEKWDIIGPLGNTFSHPKGKTPVLVGGGVGFAPVKFLAARLLKNYINYKFYTGARTALELPFTRQDSLFPNLKIASDDGSIGFKGTVVDMLESELDKIQTPYIHACGPKPMLKSLRQLLLEKNIPGEFSLENRMACGVGVCQGCAVPVVDGFKLVCKDGPIFPFELIDEGYWK